MSALRIFRSKFSIILFFLSLIFTFLFNINKAYAQNPITAATSSAVTLPTALNQIPTTISPSSPFYTDLIVHNLFHSFSCLAVGHSIIEQPCLTYQVTRNSQGVVQSIPVLSQINTSGGVLGTTTSLIGMLYTNRPIKTTDYLASVGQDLGIIKKANAQVIGSGAQVLNPILRLWQVSRNISYVVLIIIFVLIGLMVMFRSKINPQTVITAQAAIPGMIVGLILITFSYFLAGLVSDMAFIGTNVVGFYFSAVRKQADQPQNLVQDISTENSLSIFSDFVGIVTRERAHTVVGTIFDGLDAGTKANLRVVIGFITAQFFAPLTASIPPPLGLITAVALPLVTGGITAADPAFTLSFLLSFIAGFVLLYAMLKLLLRLVTAYLTIIFLTISAPFQFLAAALPGRQGIATGWILSMLGNVLAFPAVLVIFYFVAFILAPLQPGKDFGPLRISNINQSQNNTVIPTIYAASDVDIIDSHTFPLFGGMDLAFIRILMAFGALVALPSIPDIVVRAIGKASQAGQMIGQEISSGVGGGQKYAGQYQQSGLQTVQNTQQGIFGKRELVYDPYSREFVRRVTSPGLLQIDRSLPGGGKTINPLKWSIKNS